jgi:putative IMPACT (imprinted ancient) family translation regulator
VSAFRYFDADKRLVEGAKDDGEPSGCAGTPSLKVLQGNALVNCAVITTRYFGGIKLGTGGMARAYGAAAKAVVEASSLDDFHHQATATLTATFDRVSELERLLQSTRITDRCYTEIGVEVDIADNEEIVEALVSEWERVNY